MTDFVFIGTVESLTSAKTPFESAKTLEDVEALFKRHGLWENSATLRIKIIFRRPGDFPDEGDDAAQIDVAKTNTKDDDRPDSDKTKSAQHDRAAKDRPRDPNDDLKEGDTVVIYTEPGGCGFDFHKGETYLVYALEDEQDTRLETTACTRTARVSDAGEDLAYLYFFQHGGRESARLEGFTTSDPKGLLRDRFQYTGRIDSPVPGIRIELESGHVSFNTTSDQNGRFVFDGLSEGSYTLSAYPSGEMGYPGRLPSSGVLRISPRSCKSTVLLIPKL